MTADFEIPAVAAVEAERALIGSMLAGDRFALDLVPLIEPDDLFLPVHQTVLTAVRVLLKNGEPVDCVTVLGELRRSGQSATNLDQTSAGVALHDMYAATPVRVAGRLYFRDVIEARVRRRVAEMGGRLLRRATTADLDSLVRLVGDEAAEVWSVVERRQKLTRPSPPAAEAA